MRACGQPSHGEAGFVAYLDGGDGGDVEEGSLHGEAADEGDGLAADSGGAAQQGVLLEAGGALETGFEGGIGAFRRGRTAGIDVAPEPREEMRTHPREARKSISFLDKRTIIPNHPMFFPDKRTIIPDEPMFFPGKRTKIPDNHRFIRN